MSDEKSIERFRTILDNEGYTDWTIKLIGDGGLCVHKTKEIWLGEDCRYDLPMFLHEMAHIKFPDHGGNFADHFTHLVRNYMSDAPIMYNIYSITGKISSPGWSFQICKHCGREQRLDFHAKHDIWNRVAGPEFCDRVLCLECFLLLADSKGISLTKEDVWPVCIISKSGWNWDMRGGFETGALRCDDDGHWFVMPLNQTTFFNELVSKGDWKQLLEEFGRYQIDGGPEQANVIFQPEPEDML